MSDEPQTSASKEPSDKASSATPAVEAAKPVEMAEPGAAAELNGPPEAARSTEAAEVPSPGAATASHAEAGDGEGQGDEPSEPPAGPSPEKGGGGRTRFNIRIGSSRRPAAKPAPPEEKKSSDAPAEPPEPSPVVEVESSEPVAPPSWKDVDEELAAVLASGSAEALMEQSTSSVVEIPLETRRRATVVRHDAEHVFFSLGGPNEGAAPLRQFESPPEAGTEFDVIVTGHNPEDNLYELSIPGASVEVADWTDIVEGAVVEVRVSGTNTGGLECKLNESIRGFIPASQIALYRVENFNDFLDKKLVCVVTQISKKGRHKSVILSHRAVLEREKEEERKQKLAQLEVGQVVEGVVRNIRDFGAFVDIGGLDGLLHVSQLSWERVSHPKDVLEVGQKIRVKIEKVNRETGKISLSYKALTDHPWTDADKRFPAQSTVTGTVSRIANFGAFVKLAPGVEGMIHVSELAHRRVGRVEDVLQEGQEVTCKVLSVDVPNQRMALSLKALEPEPQAEAEPAAADEKPRKPRRQNPNLRGGLDRPAGGEKFGLKW